MTDFATHPPLRVLQFVADGAAGGGTTHVAQIVRAFKQSHTLGLVTQGGSYLASLARQEGIEVFESRWFGAASLPRSLRELGRVLNDFRPDLVHCHGGRAAFYYSLLQPRLPMLYTIHGLHYARRKAIGRAAGRWQHRRAIGSAAHVIFVCQYDRQLAQRDRLLPSGKPHCVIYNGVDLPSAREHRPDASPRSIGFVGRLVDQKHPELFVDVVERLPGASAVMVGGGPLATAIDAEISRRGLSSRLRRLGELDRDATLAALSQFGILVMTSRWEGLPLLPLEAMHLGVPVVATAVGGVAEIIEHERTGLLADECPASLAAAVERLQTDLALRSEIIEAARRDVHARFSEQGMLEAIETLYARLTSPSTAAFAGASLQ